MANNKPTLDISTFDPKKIQSFIGKKGTSDVSIGVPSEQTTPKIGIGSTDAKLPSIAQDIAAPVAPIATKPIAPVTPAPEVAPVSKEQIRTNITSSFGKAGTQGIANAAAVRGLLKFSDQPVTEERVAELSGMRLGDLVEQINPALAEQIPGFMVRDEVKTEVTPTGVTDRLTTEVTDVPEAPKSASDQLKSLLTTLPTVRGEAEQRAKQDVGLESKRQAVSDAKLKANKALEEVNLLKRRLEIAGVEDFREEEGVLGKPLLKSTINAELQRLSRDQQFDKMLANIEVGIAIDSYNSRLAELQIAQGDYREAEKIVSETADEAFEGAELHIQALEALGEIEKEEATSLRKDLEYERDLRLDGYVPLEGTLADNLVGNDRNMLFEDPTSKKVYRRPTEKPITDKFKIIKGTENQVGGVFNETTGKFEVFAQPSSEGTVMTSTGDSYDIGSYATDPNHEANIQGMLQKMGQFKSVADIDEYINKVAPTSPITGQMVANAGAKHGVSWEVITAIMQQDSSLGTAGIGARNFNPGNIAQFDSLGTTPTAGYKSWQEGVDAVAKNLAWRKVAKQEVSREVSSLVKLVQEESLTAKEALAQVPKNQKSELLDALSVMSTPQDTKEDAMAKEKKQMAISLKDHKGLNSVVGPVALARIDITDRFGAAQDFIGSVDQLISDLSLDSLISAKERGATFGALSDTEMQILASAATKMGTWQKKNKDGETTHYEIDEKSFKSELDNISKIFDRAIKGSIESEPEIPSNAKTMPDGTSWVENEDGTYTQVN